MGNDCQSPIASVQRTRSTLASHSAVSCGRNDETKGIATGGVKTAIKGGVSVSLRLSTFARVCLRLLAFSPLRLLAFVCVCLRLLAFAYAPLCYAPPLRDTEKWMNANRAIRIAAQRTQGLWGLVSVFRGGWRYDCQRTLAIRIAAITLASDSATTIARFRPSKGDAQRQWLHKPAEWPIFQQLQLNRYTNSLQQDGQLEWATLRQ